jgi:protocatechuate 3,4-dioxygenase beta subunit
MAMSNPGRESRNPILSTPGRHGPKAIVMVVVAVHLGAVLPTLIGCECAPPPPPCAAYTETELIFLGTVTELGKGQEARVARMRIDKTYKGVLKRTVNLFDDGMCDGPHLEAGQQYLMYTNDNGTDYLPARGCTRSRHVRFAKEDLAFLNGLSKAPATSTVLGQVSTLRSGVISEDGKPAAGASVEIEGERQRRKSTTDQHGRYSFSGLNPGSYRVRAMLPGFTQREDENDDSVDVIARGCEVLDVVLHKNWDGRLSGHVVRADGKPAPGGIHVDLIRADTDVPERASGLLVGSTVQTDDQGNYAFEGVAPGHYKVVLNVYMPPTFEYPFTPLYWPSAGKGAAASTVEITETARAQCDFRLPPPLKSTPVKLVVLAPDGTPARDVRINIGTSLEGLGFTWAGVAFTDAHGQVSFPAVEGYKYTVPDIFAPEGRSASAAQFSSMDATKPIMIQLVPR